MKAISLIGVLIVLCSLCSSCSWQREVQREFVVCDTQNRPVKGARVYVLREFTGDDYGIAFLPYFGRSHFRKMDDDHNVTSAYRPLSNSMGQVDVNMKLYYPGDHSVLFMAKGYYPTIVRLTGKMNKVFLLDEKNFKFEGSSVWDIYLRRLDGAYGKKIPAIPRGYFDGRYWRDFTPELRNDETWANLISYKLPCPNIIICKEPCLHGSDSIPIFQQDKLSKQELNILLICDETIKKR